MSQSIYPRLSEAGPEAIFTLPDTSTRENLSIECVVEQESGGIAIRPGDLPNGEGRPVFIEWRNGTFAVHVWTDPNSDCPTHSIEIPLDY